MSRPRLLETVGNTPAVRLELTSGVRVGLFAKLEFCNPMGSVKDRAAAYILEEAVRTGEVDSESWIVESSSGNFGVSLAAYAKHFGLRFRCVIDPRISALNEMLIRKLGATVIRVDTQDATGGYLLTRIAEVRSFLASTPEAFWTNQYANPRVADAYYHTLGAELCDSFERIDYVFVAVSSGGTIAGVSRRIKEKFPSCRVVAVDAAGSVVFGGAPRARFIPGIGSSMVPPILATAVIDDVVVIDEISAVEACHRLLSEHGIFAGGSSGFVIAAIERYFASKPPNLEDVVLAVLPDRGERYMGTVFNPAWCAQLREGALAAAEAPRS